MPMPVGVVFATKPLADTAVAAVATALGYPRCERINGTVIGNVAPCLCTSDGKGANVHAACPHATRRQTQTEATDVGTYAMPVDAVMTASTAAKAVPAILSPVVYALPLVAVVG